VKNRKAMVRMIRRRRLLKKLVVMLSLVKKGKAMLRMIRRRRLVELSQDSLPIRYLSSDIAIRVVLLQYYLKSSL